MSNDTLPPLPEPESHRIETTAHPDTPDSILCVSHPAFAAEQMRLYGEECYRLATERAARLVKAASILNDWDQEQLVAAIRAGKGERE